MTATLTNSRSRLARDLRAGMAAALAVLVLAVTPVSSANPTRKDIDDAKAQLAEMDLRLGLLVEEYDQTQVEFDAAQNHLGDLRGAMDRAQAARQRAMERLGDAVREAYKNQVSNLGLILSSDSLSVLSDRIYFLDVAAQDQEDLATRAEVATQRARRVSDQLQRVVDKQRDLLRRLSHQQADIEQGIADQKALIGHLEQELRQEILEQRRREAAPPAPAPSPPSPPAPPSPSPPPSPPPPPPPSPPSSPTGGTTTIPPPVSGSGAAAAIAAAESVLGVPYVYAGASPQTGFDCSGLTMWAWAHAGVSLPHSSQMQYASLPHVSKDQLQPGDLVFFYSPIHHVGLYVGGGMMIHAPHTGSVVSKVAVYWEYFTGAARPG